MRNIPMLSLAAAVALALAACTGGGGTASPSPTGGNATTSEGSPGGDKVYSEEELRMLVSGMTDADGNELNLYSKDQVDVGERIARILMGSAKVEPTDCKDIATAGLLESVESGEVAIAISGSEKPRTLSGQSGKEGPGASELLTDMSAKMDRCSTFTIETMGQRVNVTSRKLVTETDGQETFATVSTRGEETTDMLMQVSAAQGRLLVVATKGGTGLGDKDRDELEDLVNKVLHKARDGSSSTVTTTATVTVTPTRTASGGTDSSPSPTGETAPGGTTTGSTGPVQR